MKFVKFYNVMNSMHLEVSNSVSMESIKLPHVILAMLANRYKVMNLCNQQGRHD